MNAFSLHYSFKIPQNNFRRFASKGRDALKPNFNKWPEEPVLDGKNGSSGHLLELGFKASRPLLARNGSSGHLLKLGFKASRPLLAKWRELFWASKGRDTLKPNFNKWPEEPFLPSRTGSSGHLLKLGFKASRPLLAKWRKLFWASKGRDALKPNFNKWPEEPFLDGKNGSSGHLLKLGFKASRPLLAKWRKLFWASKGRDALKPNFNKLPEEPFLPSRKWGRPDHGRRFFLRPRCKSRQSHFVLKVIFWRVAPN